MSETLIYRFICDFCGTMEHVEPNGISFKKWIRINKNEQVLNFCCKAHYEEWKNGNSLRSFRVR
jgi:hypothetical protein